MRSITDVLFALGDDAIVHPGHGPDTTIGRERRTNPFVLEYLRGTIVVWSSAHAEACALHCKVLTRRAQASACA